MEKSKYGLEFIVLLSVVVITVLILLNPLIFVLWSLLKIAISALVPLVIVVILFRTLGWLFSKSLHRTEENWWEYVRYGDKEEEEEDDDWDL